MPEVIQKVGQRYSFAYTPNLSRPWNEISTEGFKFRIGMFVSDGFKVNINEFTLLPQGLVVDAPGTDEGERFLDDLLEWAKPTLGLRPIQRELKKWFYSQVVVEFDNPMNNLLRNFESLSNNLGMILSDYYDVDEAVQLYRITLNCDKLKLPSSVYLTDFTIERRLNHPYEEERFISAAPLRTQDHLKLLEELEKTAASSN
jgi:hypothetical protein